MSNNSDIQMEASMLKIVGLEKQFRMVMDQYKQSEAAYIADMQNYKEQPKPIQLTSTPSPSYTMIGVGQDGLLYGKESLNTGNWTKIHDNAGSNLTGICTANNGTQIYVSAAPPGGSWGDLYYKPDYSAPTYSGPLQHGGGVNGAFAFAKDGSAVCLKSDGNLYYCFDILNTDWQLAQANIGCFALAISHDDYLYILNGAYDWYRQPYSKIPSYVSDPALNGGAGWEYIGHTDPILSFTFTQDDILVSTVSDGRTIQNPSYKTNFNGGWLDINANNVPMKSVTFVTGGPQQSPKTYTATIASAFLKNNLWDTDDIITSNQNGTMQQCVDDCAADSTCTGAMYNPSDHDTPYCFLYKGTPEVGGGMANDYTIVPSASSTTPIKCLKTSFDGGNTSANVCVNKKNDSNYCYGSAEGCLWGANDCNTDADCSKYNSETSPQYTDMWSCTTGNEPTYWGDSVCKLYPNADTIENTGVTIAKKDSAVLTSLNQQLIDIMNEYQKELVSMAPSSTEAETKKLQLNGVYDQLMADRAKIAEMLIEYERLDQKYDDNMLNVDQSNSEFILWFAFVILIISYIIKTTAFPNSSVTLFRMFFWMVLLLLFIICSFQINKGPGFLLWGVILIFFAIVQMKIVPSP